MAKTYKLANANKAFLETVNAESSKKMREYGVELLKRIVEKTPVATGRAKANWQIGLNKRQTSILGDTDPTPLGSAGDSFFKGLKIISRVKYGDTIYIMNNLPYIGSLEHGSSTQAASGMVQVSFNELKAFLK